MVRTGGEEVEATGGGAYGAYSRFGEGVLWLAIPQGLVKEQAYRGMLARRECGPGECTDLHITSYM